jgi:alcohol dehydrogenase (cytochrome c)
MTAHDAKAGKEIWRTRTIPKPGEPGDETWGGLPDANRRYVGTWMGPRFDPERNMIYIGKKYLYHNSTLALDADTGKIV